MTWTSEHILLLVGLITLLIIGVTTLGFRVIRNSLKGEKRDKFRNFLNILDKFYVLPAMWVLAAVSILYWLVARILIVSSTSQNILLFVGIVTLALIGVTTLGFRVIRNSLKGEKRDRFRNFLNTLDKLYLLPAMWVLAVVSILYWALTQIFISYS